MPKKVDRKKYPEDNSHLPITITDPDNRGGWWVGTRFQRLSPNFIDLISCDGHKVSVTIEDTPSPRPQVCLNCSCGHSEEIRYLNLNGSLPSYGLRRWMSHQDELTHPLHVATSKAVRVQYEWYVATGQQARDVLKVRPNLSNQMFWVVRRSVSIKTGKVSTVKAVGAKMLLKEAIADTCFLVGKYERDGKRTEWHYTKPVDRPSGKAATILNMLEEASDLRSMMEAKKMANDYLQFGELIKVRLGDVERKIRDQMDIAATCDYAEQMEGDR